MKKIALATLLLLSLVSTAFAGSITLEGQDQLGDKGAKNSVNYQLSVKEPINKMLAVDVAFANYQQHQTEALSTRLETGITAAVPVGAVGVYTRVAVGEKYNNTGNFAYYSIEPGVTYTVGAVTAKVGYRYRTAMVNPNVSNDTTDTSRFGLSYALTKKDAVGVRFDRVIGDSTNHSYNLNYTRSF
jgi:hypothetical protein